MGATINSKTIPSMIADLLKRVEKLETGGKKLSGISGTTAVDAITVANGETTSFIVTTSWKDAAITDNPKADLYWDAYVNTDNNELFSWPNGTSVTATQKRELFIWDRRLSARLSNDHSKSFWLFTIHNNTGSPVTLYFYITSVYLSGQSGSSS